MCEIAASGGCAKDCHVHEGKFGRLTAFGKQDEERSCALQKTQSVGKRATTQSVGARERAKDGHVHEGKFGRLTAFEK
jgi:hypothetical protein